MFGKDEAIRDVPPPSRSYHVDYRETLSNDPSVRWTDRMTSRRDLGRRICSSSISGSFSARLCRPQVPFQLQPDLFRKDETLVHEAIREALVNA